ncbi:hypothetical protein F5B19DRAFT_446137 [Rostrohypoxylon terebratum]|nr:hypothetical protein F5B19DRAFT_446137 [Rostrohypoxylon terebratum]
MPRYSFTSSSSVTLLPQAILVNKRVHHDMALSPHLGAYRAAEASSSFTSSIDVEVLCHSWEGLFRSWPSGLLKMLSDFSARNTKTIFEDHMYLSSG